MPHHTFYWEGIDGTRVFTHFPPVDTYNSDLSAARAGARRTELPGPRPRHHLAGAVRVRRRRRRAQPGDAGRGAAAADLGGIPDRCGSARRPPSSARPRPSIRRAGLGGGDVPGTAPRHLHQPGQDQAGQPAQRTPAPGGRALERHRRVTGRHPYPAAELKRLWQLVLLQQFHDILPGSSIAWVHQDAERNYAAVAERAEKIIDEALRALVGEGQHLLRQRRPARQGRRARAGSGSPSPEAVRSRPRKPTAATSWTTASSGP